MISRSHRIFTHNTASFPIIIQAACIEENPIDNINVRGRRCGDLDDDIGDGLTGGSNIEEVEASRESSGSIGGAGGRDLHLERGMLG